MDFFDGEGEVVVFCGVFGRMWILIGVEFEIVGYGGEVLVGGEFLSC